MKDHILGSRRCNYLKYSIVALFVSACFSVTSARAQSMKIAEDGMAVINGKRTFILGLYEYPQDDKVLKQVAESGFNIIAVQAKDSVTTVKNLDRLSAHGIGAWITGNFDLSQNTQKVKKGLARMVLNYGSHPALLVWEVPDEALWNISTKAWDYRSKAEIKLLEKEISSLKDSSAAKLLRIKVKSITELYNRGAFAEGQQSADRLWKELGRADAVSMEDISATPLKIETVARGLKEGYDFVKSLDPAHPIFMNHAPRNQIHQLAMYNRAADIIGCDIYPVPEYRIEHSDLADMSLSSVGAYTKRMMEAAPGKPVWMVLQGFGWGDLFGNQVSAEKREELRRPTMKETRFMAYDAIVNGARGINYWGTYLVPRDAQMWSDILAIGHELNKLQAVISARDAVTKTTVKVGEAFNSLDRPVRVLAKQVGKDLCLIVVNENKNQNPLPFAINGLEEQNGKKFVDFYSGTQVVISKGSLNTFIEGQGVQLWQPLNR